MLSQCRQGVDNCGGAALIPDQSAIPGAVARTVLKTKMKKFEKCTWISRSKIGAPTFKAAAAASDAMMTTKYDMHYAEYNTGSNAQPAKRDATKHFISHHFSWATLKGRYYDKTQFDGIIENGQAWMWTHPAATTGQTGFGMKRWFPVAVAEAEVAQQTARNTAYNALLTTYNAAKTTYDAAVKPSTTKADFFATLFSPPKKSTVPLRPNQPTRPAAYTGLFQHPFPLAGYAVATVGASGQAVTANAFVVDGMHGGWGQYTMGMLKQTTAMQKSFGVFGWGKDVSTTYMAEEQSFVQDWTDMCILPAVTGNGKCPTATSALTTTAIYQILAVSIWANDFTAVDFATVSGGSTLVMTFHISKWKQNAAKWAKPGQPAAGVAPSIPAGAKMLVASTAAAAAVYAALY